MSSSAAPAARRLGPSTPAVSVPVLVDPARGVRLRAHQETDLDRLVEQGRDPQTLAWTNAPDPPGGYGLAEARDFLAAGRVGWAEGRLRTWAVTRTEPGAGRYEATVTLALLGDGRGDLSFVAHPDARGRGTTSAAVRLVVAHAFTVERLAVVRWEAYAGHLASWRVAAAAGLRWEGTRRLHAVHRGELRDVWTASLAATDTR